MHQLIAWRDVEGTKSSNWLPVSTSRCMPMHIFFGMSRPVTNITRQTLSSTNHPRQDRQKQSGYKSPDQRSSGRRMSLLWRARDAKHCWSRLGTGFTRQTMTCRLIEWRRTTCAATSSLSSDLRSFWSEWRDHMCLLVKLKALTTVSANV